MTRKTIRNTKRKVTISDIARESDVSPATVSLVLRDKPGVGDDTRQRVWSTAQSLGYVLPSKRNRVEQAAETRHIGLVIKINPDDVLPTANHFYAHVLTGIEQVCRQQNSHLFYANLPVDEHNNPIEVPRLLAEENIDGLLLVGVHLDEMLQNRLEHFGKPIVLVDGYATGNILDSVVTDNEQGAYDATVHLINKGHTRIAFIGSEANAFASILERRSGYLNAMVQHALPPLLADSSLHTAAAVKAARKILKSHPDITAFVVANDELAVAIMKALQESGRNIPADISLIGFDNILLAQHVTPALTTMRVDKMGMGRLAAQLLFNRIEYTNSAEVHAIIRPHLLERDSVSERNG